MKGQLYQKIRGNQKTLGRGWQDKEVETLRKMAGKTHTKLIARILDRSYESVRRKAFQERIPLRRNPQIH